MSLTLTVIQSKRRKTFNHIHKPAVPSKWFGSAACNTIRISIHPSVHKQLIRIILEGQNICLVFPILFLEVYLIPDIGKN